MGDRARAYLRRAGTKIENHYRGVVKGLSLETRLSLTGPERVAQSEQLLDEIFASHFRNVKGASALSRMLYADTKVWLPENLLLKGDKMTMATAVELRVPFLDHEFVEHVVGLPAESKVRGWQTKLVLREALRDLIPAEILTRRKMGFPVPVGSWLKNEFSSVVDEFVSSPRALNRSLFNSDCVRELVNSRTPQGTRLWLLINLEIWQRIFLDGEEIESIVGSRHKAAA